jgi:quercetin dioxygenase-like cupin family protein
MGRVDVALEEYKALRAEIIALEQAQTTTVNVALTATAAIGGIAFGVRDNGDERLEILLVLPIILAGLGLVYLNNTYGSHRLGHYIRTKLWPVLQNALPAQDSGSIGRVPSWEARVDETRTLGQVMRDPVGYLGWLPGLLIFGVPSVAALILNADARPAWARPGDAGSQLSAAWTAGLIALVLAFLLWAAVGIVAALRAQKTTEEATLAHLSSGDLPGEATKQFVGADHGAHVSFYLAHDEQGSGPPLHRHPYEEVFIIQQGSATFTVDGETIEAGEGDIVIVPAGAKHRFVNSGDGVLRQVTIHPAERMEQKDEES